MKKIFNICFILIGLLFLGFTNVNAASECRTIVTKDACTAKSDCLWSETSSTCYTNPDLSDKITITNDGKNITQTTTDKNGKTTTKTKATNVSTKTPLDFCASTASIWQIVGWIFLIVKIVIPLLLIILGVKDLAQAVISGKDDGVKGAAKSLMIRGIAAILIFFIPTLVSLIMGLVVDFSTSGAADDFEVCQTCILNPNKCNTSRDVGKQ